MKEKPLFSAYVSLPERLWALNVLFFVPLCIISFSTGTHFISENFYGRILLLLLLAGVGYMFIRVAWGHLKPQVQIYASGIKITGYPFFLWRELQRAEVTSILAWHEPFQQLELIPAKDVRLFPSLMRRLLLRKDYCNRVIMPFWPLSASTRVKLLAELGARIPAPATIELDKINRLRLFFRKTAALMQAVGTWCAFFVFAYFLWLVYKG